MAQSPRPRTPERKELHLCSSYIRSFAVSLRREQRKRRKSGDDDNIHSRRTTRCSGGHEARFSSASERRSWPRCACLATSRHVWFRTAARTVVRDGRPDSHAVVYHTGEGAFVIDARDEGEWYAVADDGRWVGVCDAPHGMSILGLAVVTRDDCVPCISYTSVKADEAHVTRGPGFVEFDARHGGRLRLVTAEARPN